ncbi:Maltooligosyl trehalose synthase [Anaerohalosphaera lusitana]|uniref:Maltooligosyl trehalose synthase n=1 Tax=Anaerohalosphaera lusitana TaxID=1936003 RepID=A0A1U9NKX8_9BACT|nr:malto-oligosyltrehalose synthase [Anaerohalosphaera lusitana]AQT68457.1 Maltooligosyl trehalose synthase [Anaerohalosphaera lusitana]
MNSKRIPGTTYRLQLNEDFGFEQARRLVPYLKRLGITHIYASPIFKANPGSGHGYDVTDPNQINPELGGWDEFVKLMEVCKADGIGWVQDIVPNHMAYSMHNSMMMSVLEHGRASAYSHMFDIDWEHPDEELAGKVMAPFLGKKLEETVANEEVAMVADELGLGVKYYEQRFPLNAGSYSEVLHEAIHGEEPQQEALGSICVRLADIKEMRREEVEEAFEGVKQALFYAYSENKEVRALVDAAMDKYNKGGRLLDLLGKQYYVLTHWQEATRRINYRRFFYINGLICMAAEREEVFDRTHKLILDCVKHGYFDGLRVDHVDGLSRPGEYLKRLRDAAPEAYIVIEKIMEKDEPLMQSWPVEGTTGYDFGAMVDSVMCDNQKADAFDRFYKELAGEFGDYQRVLYDKKKEVLGTHMAGDAANLVRMLKGDEFAGEDDDELCEAAVSLAAACGIYRTYLGEGERRSFDVECVERAVEGACEYEQRLADVIRRLGDMLLKCHEQGSGSCEFALRFQQLSAPAMAKGFEDTLLYIYNRHIALNEVGGSPDQFGIPADEFQKHMAERVNIWPNAMNGTSTHDSKRGEDVRARLNVLSEMGEAWFENVRKWRVLNEGLKTSLDGQQCPDANDEYLIYQTMVGALPFEPSEQWDFRDRLKEYAVKALREAKVHTSWLAVNAEYEESVTGFIDGLFDEGSEFWGDFAEYTEKVSRYGVIKSLAGVVVKMTCPGVPDIYQGSELWNLSLVDPDNRRAVDYAMRERMFERLDTEYSLGNNYSLAELLAEPADGMVKMFVVHRLLEQRQQQKELYRTGTYIPLEIEGDDVGRLIAYARENDGRAVIVLVPRLCYGLTSLPERGIDADKVDGMQIVLPQSLRGDYRCLFSGRHEVVGDRVSAAKMFSEFPIAVLERR